MPSIPALLRRALVVAATLCTVLTASASGASAAPAGQTPPASTLKLSALAFAQQKVDARSFVAVRLTWTVTNSDRSASGMGGDLTVQQRDGYGAPLGTPVDIPFSYQTSGFGWMGGWVSGTPQKSTYVFDFAVPSYAAGTSTTWVVSHISVTDGSHPLDADLAALGHYKNTLTARTNPDTVLPSADSLSYSSVFGAPQPYVFIGPSGGSAGYSLTVQDWQSGFWKGALTLRGPGGQSVTADFALRGPDATTSGYSCGFLSGGDNHEALCGVSVAFPPGAAAGVWTVSQISVYDNAGNHTVVADPPGAQPLTLTSNATLSASDFAFTPNPVDNWTGDAVVPLSMRVTGAVGGVAAIYVERGGAEGCSQWGNTPTVAADGTVSVPIRLYSTYPVCTPSAIAVVDGAGNVALYGSGYGAPDPGVQLKQMPDTTPPVVTGATLSRTSVPVSELSSTSVVLTVTQAPSLAPVHSYDIYVYDADGNVVDEALSGVSQQADGSVRLGVPLSWLTAGTYTVGFALSDAARLTSRYGIPGFPPVPGGPLVITITP